MTVSVDTTVCDLCGCCVAVCPADSLTLFETELVVDDDRCTGCGRCVKVCAFGALACTTRKEADRA